MEQRAGHVYYSQHGYPADIKRAHPMSQPAVVFDHVWKKFRRGERHDSLRDAITAFVKRPFQRRTEPDELADRVQAAWNGDKPVLLDVPISRELQSRLQYG